ncbi:ABC transporter ATP-binding protein [Halosolutus gelatinilyticus]|uniref:dipeptide ABC transporter ATP-binding protein n=1 Tax=Halosolutus gelatinilyticus TaxID=2931975 RepID=UPI001FF3A971|nr:ABC transporter ATP-binding protein [Halosolutus gelatinilyticus]
MTANNALEIENLHVRFDTRSETVHAVNGVSCRIKPGEIVGLVGESGCGKSVTARSIVRLEAPGEIVDGSIRYDGRELTTADERTLRRLRGRELAMVFQDPSTTLNPVYPVGEQIAEALRIHRDPDHQPLLRELARGTSSRLRSSEVRSEVLKLMGTVGIPRPSERIDAYPHQFSGGMRQRAMIAIALARRPSLLIADEPTTALDTTTQAAILERLAALNAEHGMGMLVISHDIGVVSQLCDRIVVMYDGVVVERRPAEGLRSNPAHPYTKALLGCLPRRGESGSRLPTVQGTPSDGSPPPAGCAFVDRCPFATGDCRTATQPVVSVGPDHDVRCGVPEAREASLETMRARRARADAARNASETSNDPRSVAVDGGATASVADAAGDATREHEQARRDRSTRTDEPVVTLEGVAKSFRESDALIDRLLGTDGRIPAVRGVSLALRPGETVGLVGESGCGKSTLAKLIVGLETPDDGTVRLHGRPIGGVDSRTDAQLTEIGVVFQHPGASLNPKRTVGAAIAEPLVEAGWSRPRRKDRIAELCSLVGLPNDVTDRYPGQLSGGQRQRVAIARAIALEPSVLVLDEPTAALDVSVQATILNLLADLQADLGLTYLFISHDIDVVRHVADRVAVMYCGRLVEIGPAHATLSRPTHPYTQTLLDAIPGGRADSGSGGDQATDALAGEPPSPADPPSGCAVHPRCPVATDECSRVEPSLDPVGDDARSRCLYADAWRDERNRTASRERDERLEADSSACDASVDAERSPSDPTDTPEID